MKVVTIKTPHGLETFLWLDRALVSLVDAKESEELLNPQLAGWRNWQTHGPGQYPDRVLTRAGSLG